MIKAIKKIYEFKNVLTTIIKSDIKSKYAGTTLGLIWALLYPLLFLTTYFVVYIMIFKVRVPELGNVDYVLLIFGGIVPWLGFADSIGVGVHCVVANKSIINNTLFPIELMPVKVVCTSLFTQFIGILMLIIVCSVRNGLTPVIFYLPIIVMLQFLFVTGIVWIISSLNVFHRDIGQMTPIVLIMLMMVSPIAYTRSMLSESLMTYMKMNPMYYLISMYRDILVIQSTPKGSELLIFTIISIVFFSLGYNVFIRLKVVFSDYV